MQSLWLVKKIATLLILAVILTIGWSINPPSASAQDSQISMGGHIGYNFDV